MIKKNELEEKNVERDLIDLVLAFGSKMNELELEIVKKDESNPNKDFFEEYKNKYQLIFKQYCSDKKRVYGGKAVSYGIPTRYDGIETAIEKTVTLKKRNRAEVYIKTTNNFDAEYLFIVLKQNNSWKVDNVKYKWWGNEKWKPQIL